MEIEVHITPKRETKVAREALNILYAAKLGHNWTREVIDDMLEELTHKHIDQLYEMYNEEQKVLFQTALQMYADIVTAISKRFNPTDQQT